MTTVDYRGVASRSSEPVPIRVPMSSLLGSLRGRKTVGRNRIVYTEMA
jgi:hypothetical protein